MLPKEIGGLKKIRLYCYVFNMDSLRPVNIFLCLLYVCNNRQLRDLSAMAFISLFFFEFTRNGIEAKFKKES